MTFVLETRTQRFTFGDSWSHGVSFDKEEDLCQVRKCMGSVSTKDTDFIGLRNSGGLWLIEVKDYRKDPANLRKHREDGILSDDIAQKVRDTIPALVGAFRSSRHPSIWNPYAGALMDRSHDLHVIFWLEEDADPRRQSDAHSMGQRGILLRGLRKKLAWLTKQVMVEGRHADSRTRLDIKVEDIVSH